MGCPLSACLASQASSRGGISKAKSPPPLCSPHSSPPGGRLHLSPPESCSSAEQQGTSTYARWPEPCLAGPEPGQSRWAASPLQASAERSSAGTSAVVRMYPAETQLSIVQPPAYVLVSCRSAEKQLSGGKSCDHSSGGGGIGSPPLKGCGEYRGG